MSTVIMTVSLSPSGEIRIGGDGTGSTRVFANAIYAAEELARLISRSEEAGRKEMKLREELNRAEKVDGTTVDLIKNLRRILDEGIPF